MKLKDLLQGIDILEMTADPQMQINGLSSDTRETFAAGTLFVALSGFAVDGNRFIPMAKEKGAVAVVTAKKPELDIPYILVENDRLTLARLAANFYDHPADSMVMVGVTGTNGKTSVT